MSPRYATYDTGASLHPNQACKAAQALISYQIKNQPRSLQKTIGPSEIGNPCDHCLTARLAGWEKQETGTPLATTIGTGYHLLMEQLIGAWQDTHPQDPARYLMEEKTMVGHVAGQPIWGSTDLLDLKAGMTIDYKVVGKTSFNKYKKDGPSPAYRAQAHLYAKGWNDMGIRVDTVSIWFIPKQAVLLESSHWWHEPYTVQIANAALARANRLWQAWQNILTEQGNKAADEYISSLPRDTHCWDCAKYKDAPAQQALDLDGLLGD